MTLPPPLTQTKPNKKMTTIQTPSLKTLTRAAIVSKAIGDHNARWNWMDGVSTIEEREAARVRRTRYDLREVVNINHLAVEWTINGRLGLMKALNKQRAGSYREYYKYGSRLRPSVRPVPLP